MKGKKAPRRKIDGKWYLCEKCDFRTVHSYDLKKHIICKHTPMEKIDWQKCKKCPKKFKILPDLMRHQKVVHVPVMDRLHCAACDFSTSLSRSLRTHFYNKHARPEEINWVECYHCGAKFKNKERLRYHLNSSHRRKEVREVKQFKCEHCDYSCNYTQNLQNHVLLKHNNDREVYQCEKCDYNTPSKLYLSSHMVMGH